ncbi:hypothetical protein BO78DRAFT_440588 [Aspergillus sclerotiicarbonarius CBS 121057]|uniref:Protein kinase domain-containing protein n=1 Tax=Aspergillus sclerotiicarbonarius (strain CBS 121057 / IBT 28362) TaxID=1448318 RepID=A0A319EPD0_ASPSB|nr:hypothetical protein BO78DRAFT_440588 [Aspergillus sclerotiicarbonarius CBS 121057]
MDQLPARDPTRSHWHIWLKYKDQICPSLPDRRDLAPEIEFLDLIADSVHSYMFKVRIQETIYALKLHAVYSPYWPPSYSLARVEDAVTENDPFIAESRVYDCLAERGLEGQVGPKCYGWLTISREQEQALDQRYNLTNGYTSTDQALVQKLNHMDGRPWLGFRQCPEEIEDPVRGLLLEYIDGTSIGKGTLNASGASSLRRQLDLLHSLDIAHGDLYPRNIMVSKAGDPYLIDFSSAQLWPCRGFQMKKGRFDGYMGCEKSALEYYLFQLQKLERHRDLDISDAKSDEDAYGGEVSSFVAAFKEEFVDCDPVSALDFEAPKPS